MLPVRGIDSEKVSRNKIDFSDKTVREFEKLGAVLQMMCYRHKQNGYSIINGRIYSPQNELICEKEE